MASPDRAAAELEPDERLWRLLRTPLAGWALVTVAELGVADHLEAGARSVDELAARTGATPDLLYRLLRALATEGVFTEESPRRFGNTDTSRRLRRGAGAWRQAALVYRHVFASLAELPRTVRTGGVPFERAYGAGWWTWLDRHPELGSTFNALMQRGAAGRATLLDGIVWRDEQTVVDVGGGNGTLLVELLRQQPGLRGVVLDLPEVAREAEERVAEAGLAERCRVVAGSFFDGVPAGADAYLLAKILHDWDDDRARQILVNVRAAAPPHARLVVIDAVVPPGDEPHHAKWTDLVMFALVGGRERTEDEWRRLLASAGFACVGIGDELIEAAPA